MATNSRQLDDFRAAYEGRAGSGDHALAVVNLAAWFKEDPKGFMAEKRRLEDQDAERRAKVAAKKARQRAAKAGLAVAAEGEALLPEEPIEGLIQELLARMREK